MPPRPNPERRKGSVPLKRTVSVNSTVPATPARKNANTTRKRPPVRRGTTNSVVSSSKSHSKRKPSQVNSKPSQDLEEPMDPEVFKELKRMSDSVPRTFQNRKANGIRRSMLTHKLYNLHTSDHKPKGSSLNGTSLDEMLRTSIARQYKTIEELQESRTKKANEARMKQLYTHVSL